MIENTWEIFYYIEKLVHGDSFGALKCLRQNAGYFKLAGWLLDSYKLVHPPEESSRKPAVLFGVALQLLLAFFFLFWDWISDVILCHQYMSVAFNQENSTRDEICAETEQILTCFEQTDAEIQSTYTIAFFIMSFSIAVSTLAYIWTMNIVRIGPPFLTSLVNSSLMYIHYLVLMFSWKTTHLNKKLQPKSLRHGGRKRTCMWA